MIEYHPKVSIGLSVFNGETYLREAIDSILAQTFTDFELIISDNASTDSTEKICKNYESKDSRICYYRNSTNIGGVNNAAQAFKLSRGQYFRWAAHDDIMAPQLIEKCVEILDNNPSIALCYPKTAQIDECGRIIGIYDGEKGCSGTAYERFIELASWNHSCEAYYGLMRAEILRKAELQNNYSDYDRTFLCEISLYGKFYKIPDVLFYRRLHPEKSTVLYPDIVERMVWFNPQLEGKNIKKYSFFINSRQFAHYLRIISKAPLPVIDKIRCYRYMLSWLLEKRRWEIISRELLSPIKKLLLFSGT